MVNLNFIILSGMGLLERERQKGREERERNWIFYVIVGIVYIILMSCK